MTSQAQYYFGPCGEGLYYDSNTCWGYSFSYVYDQNAGTIEYSAYNADGTLSDTICDKGRVYFTGNNKMVVFWEKGLDGVQGVPEYFTPNTSGAMAE